MKKGYFYLIILCLSILLSFCLWGVFTSEGFNNLKNETEVFFSITVIALIFSGCYFLLYLILKKYSNEKNKILMTFITIASIILGYVVSILVGEFLAKLSNNFFDTMSCRGPGCVGLVMTLYGRYFLIVVPIFLIIMIILFRYQLNKDIENPMKNSFNESTQ